VAYKQYIACSALISIRPFPEIHLTQPVDVDVLTQQQCERLRLALHQVSLRMIYGYNDRTPNLEQLFDGLLPNVRILSICTNQTFSPLVLRPFEQLQELRIKLATHFSDGTHLRY